MGRLREWLLGAPEQLDLPQLRRALRRGDAGLRVRAARALPLSREGSRAEDAAPLLRPLLADPLPAMRRAAAMGLGRLAQAEDAPRLLRAAATERCETPLSALLAAAMACGAAPSEALALLERRFHLPLLTVRGWRSPMAALGGSAEAWIAGTQALREALRPGDPASDLATLRREGPAGAGAEALRRLAAGGDPRHLEALLEARRSAGRRGDHRVLAALGLHGDPRALGLLADHLERMDVDPGRGFAQRRQAALALGQLGLPEAAPRLLRALETEALEHEGRPGAGLGVQFPVRARLLWALGEVQATSAAPQLVAYLGNLHGSALGGFHLPAMQALLKLGSAARAPLLALLRDGSEDGAVHAASVLAALGETPEAERAAATRGGRVAEAWAQAVAGSEA
ncbi:MAG: hypothetical protein H6741_10295 [Alphaproteobacteria bacterium]|nr:hypothetical protein [Alphaproteobacteria bacterium]